MAIGVVDYAVCATVLPWNLCVAFKRSQSYMMRINIYRNGEEQRLNATTTSRKVWELSQRLTAEQLGTLRSFFAARRGVEAFYFYDVNETTGFAYDATGVSATGRYAVRFEGPWEASLRGGTLRGSVSFRLVELVTA